MIAHATRHGAEQTFFCSGERRTQAGISAAAPRDFYSASSSDEVTFSPADGGTAQMMILHADVKDFRLKRLP
jgi:hypothetical protein